MQLTIYYLLNFILAGLVIGFAGSAIFINFKFANADNRMMIFVIFLVLVLICFYGFKYLEKNYDRKIVKRNALKGNIALANILKAERVRFIKDTSLKSYCLWEVEIEYYDTDHKKHNYTIIEKFNINLEKVPTGYVFITNDPSKEKHKLIIPNIIISHIPELAPIVTKFENKYKPRYLNVYYRDGLIIETYKESLAKKA